MCILKEYLHNKFALNIVLSMFTLLGKNQWDFFLSRSASGSCQCSLYNHFDHLVTWKLICLNHGRTGSLHQFHKGGFKEVIKQITSTWLTVSLFNNKTEHFESGSAAW